MKTAIIGFSGSGKTELFRALAGPGVSGSRAMVKVPEPRLEPLSELLRPKKITHIEIEYLDPPGGRARALGSRVLSDIRGVDCLLAVLDAFTGAQDPLAQKNSVEAELIISDMAVIEKKLDRIREDRKKDRHLYDPLEEELLIQALQLLEHGKPLRADRTLARHEALKGFAFLSAKPILYAWNVKEDRIMDFNLPAEEPDQVHIAFSARLEREMSELEDQQEVEEFMRDLGVTGSVLDRVVSKTFELLGLITYLTTAEKQVRAWPLKRGRNAWEAAGAIHSDIQRGFIRAEVLSWEDFLRCKSFKKAKELGLLRLEGREYIVQDGDIITFRFNV